MFTARIFAITLPFAWEPSPTATGYRLYWSTTGVYTAQNSKDVGNTLTGAIDLDAPASTRVMVRAYDAQGESENSNELDLGELLAPEVANLHAEIAELKGKVAAWRTAAVHPKTPGIGFCASWKMVSSTAAANWRK